MGGWGTKGYMIDRESFLFAVQRVHLWLFSEEVIAKIYNLSNNAAAQYGHFSSITCVLRYWPCAEKCAKDGVYFLVGASLTLLSSNASSWAFQIYFTSGSLGEFYFGNILSCWMPTALPSREKVQDRSHKAQSPACKEWSPLNIFPGWTVP